MLSSILVTPLPPTFLETYSLSMPSLGFKVFSIVISFPVFWFIYLSSSLFYFKNGPEYISAQAFILFDEIPAVESSFQKLLHFSEILFCNLSLYLRLFKGVRFQYSQVNVVLLFFKRSDFFLIWLFYLFRFLYFSASLY